MKYALIFALLLPFSAIANDRKPPPEPEPRVETKTVIVEDSDKSKHLIVGATIVAVIVCWYSRCWEEKPKLAVKSLSGDDR